MPRYIFVTQILCICAGCSLFQDPNADPPKAEDTQDVSDTNAADSGVADVRKDIAPDLKSTDASDVTVDIQTDPISDIDADLITHDPPWWNTEFNSRVEMQILAPLADRPVRVVIPFTVIAEDEWFEDAKDLRFVQGTTELKYEVERVDALEISAWVRVPDLMEPVYAYWGRDNAASVRDPDTVWDQYEAVFHFDDDRDATGRGLNADATGGVVKYEDSEIGRAAVFNQGWLRYDSISFLDVTVPNDTSLLIESRFKTANITSRTAILWKESLCAGWTFLIVNSKLHPSFVNTPNVCDDKTYEKIEERIVAVDTWTTIAVHYDLTQKTMKLFSDGRIVASQTIDNVGFTGRGNALRVGVDWEELEGFDGAIDELHFSRRIPTRDDIEFSDRNLNGKAVTFAAIERLR